LLRRGAPTRRASETVGSNNPDEIGINKTQKIIKELFINLNGATGGLNKKSLSVVRLRHSKKRFPKLLSPNINIQKINDLNKDLNKPFKKFYIFL